MFELFVSFAASSAPADGETKDKQECGSNTDQAANQSLLGDLLTHGDVGLVYLLAMLVLQSENVVLGLVLLDAEDVQSADVAVVGLALPLLLHGVHIVTGAGHQRQLALNTLNLPRLLGYWRPTELNLNSSV